MKRWKILIIVLIIVLAVYFALYTSAIAEDSYEDDDTYQNSSNIPTNASFQYHTINEAGDIDWINFSAIIGSLYVIETFNLSASTVIDTHMGLYDTDGTTRLDYNDDIINGEVRRSRIIWNATATGTYFVNASELYNLAGGDYNIRVMRVGHLVPEITNPSSNTNISSGKSFIVNASLKCLNGVCLNVTAYLDPEEKDSGANKVSTRAAEMLHKEGKVKVIVEFEEEPAAGGGKLLVMSAKKKPTAFPGKRIIGALSNNRGFKLKRELNEKMLAAEVDASAMEYISSSPEVKAVYYDRPVHAFLDLSVPQINGDNVHVLQVNGVNITGEGQTVCVLDTGINYSHSDFGSCSRTTNISDGSCAKVVGGYDYVNDDADPYDDHFVTAYNSGHGSHVSGIIASEDSKYKGVAPGARIVSIKVLNSAGGGSSSDVISGIQWCINQKDALNITAISMSLGELNSKYDYHCEAGVAPEKAVVEDAVAKNISVFISSGNEDYTDGISTPACIESAISVGAVTDTDTLTYNRGVILDIVAPGVTITSTDHDSTHASKSGTSMATPHASGTAALLQQYSLLKASRTLTTAEIKHKLRFNAFNIYDIGNYLTFPRIDAYAATVAKGMIPTAINAEPFYTTSANPSNLSCLEWMTNDTTCNQSWTVYTTGTPNTTWEFFSVYETEYRFNKSNRFNVTILNATTITLNSQDNASYSSNSSIIINCSASSAYNLTNITLYHNMTQWHANSTTNISGLSNSSLWQLNFSDASYEWNCRACNIHDCFFATYNYTFTVDTTYPVFEDVNYSSLIELGGANNITANLTELHLSYVNLSINGSNYTMTLSGSIANYTFLPYYNLTHDFTIYAMDLASNLNSSSYNFTANDSTPAPVYYSTELSNLSIGYGRQQTASVIVLDGYPVTVFLDHNDTNVTMSSVSSYNFSYSWNISQCSPSVTYKLHANNTINQSNYTTGSFDVVNCCGNSACEAGESCSSCSADCGQCSSVTSSSGGGGGGGGGRTSSPPTLQNFIFKSPEPGESVEAKLTSPLIPVDSVSFVPESSTERTVLRVEAVDDGGVAEPENTYKLLKIELTGGTIESANISFKVPVSWVENNSASIEDVALKRYFNKEWGGLNTKFVKQKDTSYIYTAYSSGFSYFAITLGQKEEPKGEPVVGMVVAEQGEEVQEAQILEEKSEENPSRINFYKIAAIILTLILISMIIFEVIRIRHEKSRRLKKRPSSASKP